MDKNEPEILLNFQSKHPKNKSLNYSVGKNLNLFQEKPDILKKYLDRIEKKNINDFQVYVLKIPDSPKTPWILTDLLTK